MESDCSWVWSFWGEGDENVVDSVLDNGDHYMTL